MNANTEKKSREKVQQTQFEHSSSTTNEAKFQLSDDYNEQYPRLDESSSSQISNGGRRASETTSSYPSQQTATDTAHKDTSRNQSVQAGTNLNMPTTFANSVWLSPSMYAGNVMPGGKFIPYIPIVPNQSNMIIANPSISQFIPICKDNISRKLSEIILTIHMRREFVSLERVQSELFNYFQVNSWQQLGIRANELNPLVNLTERLKKVTFFMQIFEQVFMLCTLHDLGPILANFLKINTYEDAHLGPLDKNPDVKRVFRYQPLDPYQPIPMITTGTVISLFTNFQAQRRSKGQLVFSEFLNELVRWYQLRTWNELGLYCKSFPYLVEVSNYVQRGFDWHVNVMRTQAFEHLISSIVERLSQLKQEVSDELGLSSYNKMKSPIAVFNHLMTITEKYLSFIPEQSFLYVTLIHLRQNELLQCLLNISIYLGTIETPDAFISELQKIFLHQNIAWRQENLAQFYYSLQFNPNIQGMDYQRLQAMIQQQQNVLSPSQNAMSTNIFNTSFQNSFQTNNRSQPKLSVSLREFCSYLFEILNKYDTALTIKQFLQIENHLCTKYSVDSFAAFKFNENDTNDNDVNLVSFLDTYQTLIDPNRELSVYGYNVSVMDRQELFEFTNQLIESNSDKQFMPSNTSQFDINSNDEDVKISDDNISILEKTVKHKFGGLLGFRTGTNIVRKAKQSRMKYTFSIIRFEESLLDFNQLDRMDTCPSMLITDENQLCEFILQCPIMYNLYLWLQWAYFFEPKYGNLKSFTKKHNYSLQQLLLLETSANELLRLPIDATLSSFEVELASLRVRSAVGHLCALITREYGLTSRVPLNVYRTSMRTWFIHLQSLSLVQGNNVDPMKYILEFLTYLPIFIGQARLIQEIVLGPLDDVFWKIDINTVSARRRIWKLADEKQRSKLEIWGHTLDINDWKNNSRWSGQQNSIENQISLVETLKTSSTLNDIIVQDNDPILTTALPASSLIKPPTPPLNSIPIDENKSDRTAFEHIETIRRGFGVDSGLDSTGQSIINNLQGMIERSLQKLSKDLYSDQGHFVLELIQNADDNQYSPDCLPTLRFVLSDKRVLVCNNEIGFQPTNVDAICNVGGSTKGKHKQGYAGHKGIGFKSVFMVSDCPEIHSRDYHFCFDTINGTQQIGYIRPIWLDRCDEILPTADEWTTCIRLPIHRGSRLQENFDNIQAKLLLFLNRLRQIEIIGTPTSSSNADQSRIFTRIDHADGKIIELQEKTVNGTIIKNFWLVVKKVLEVPQDIKEKLCEVKCDIHSTTIAVAYPLNNLQKSIQQLPPAQPLFAYLPLRSYGFRFILQADFEIPVTRQEILHDNIWNEWLKSEMVQLLPLAYTYFQGLPDLLTTSLPQSDISGQLSPVQVLIYFLKLIPTRNELDPYFNAFVDKSMKSLMGIIKLPVFREDKNGQMHTEWVQTSQCVLVKDPFIRKILPQELLLSHFNKYYVPEQLASECNERTLIKLGCAPLQFSSIIRLIKELYKSHEQEHSTKTSSIEQIAQWLVCIDYILQQQESEQPHSDQNERITTTTLAELKQLKIIPISGQSRFVSIDEYHEGVILLPLSKTARYNKPFKIILDDLPRLDERLLEYIEHTYPRRFESIECLLKKLGMIDKPQMKDIYRLYIRPTLLDSNRWPKKSDSVLVAFLLCIYTHFEQFENELNQLQRHMVIKTRNGKFVRLDTPGVIIHLTSIYGCTRSLEPLTSSKHEFTFISDDYINNYRTDLFSTNDEINSFVRFLEQLNITEFFQVNISDTRFIKVSQLQSTQWAYLIPHLDQRITQPFAIEDCSSDEFNTLIAPSNNTIVDIDLYSKLLIYLDRHHDIFSRYYTASIILADQLKSGRRRPETSIPSTFCLSMRQHAWIPIEDGKLGRSDDVYCLHPKSETSVFHRYVSHLDQVKLSLKNKDFILNTLGLKEHVLPMTMFEIFIKWSCALDRDMLWTLVNELNPLDLVPCTQPTTVRHSCYDTIDNIRRVYRFLLDDNETFNLLNRFRCWPLVFVPRNNSEGVFLFAQEVFWHDSLSLLSGLDNSNHRISIQRYYENDVKLQNFFLETLQVTFEPAIDDYFPLLTQIPRLKDLWRLIEVILRLAFEQNRQTEIKERCLNLPFIPCMNAKNRRVKYTDRPFYPHDLDIANSLANRLLIIQLPDWNISSEFKNDFCSLFEIPSLEDVIQIEVHVDNEKSSIDLFNFYFHSIEFIQHFLLTKSFLTEERSKSLASSFARMHFVCVDQIELSYSYQIDTLRKEMCDTYVDERAGRFYILKKFEKSEIRHIETMAKYLVQDRRVLTELISLMMELSRIYQNEGEQGLMKRRDSIITLEHDYRWKFPNVYVIQSSPRNEDISLNDEPIDISIEMTEKLMNEPLPERKSRSRITTDKDDEKNLTCFPAKANTIHPTEVSTTKSHSSEEKNESTSSTKVSKSKPASSSSNTISSESKKSDGNHTRKHNETVNSTEKPTNKARFSSVNIDCSNSSSIDIDIFQRIRISTLTGVNVYPLSLSSFTIDPSSDAVDDKIGRQGEEIVFRYLQWKYPNEHVEWMNSKQESGRPYDICMRINNQIQLFEVKTTRNRDQHTFQISINEIECLLKNSKNYHIYRVYYSDNPEMTKITILSEVKKHLEQKRLALCMTVMQRSDEQSN